MTSKRAVHSFSMDAPECVLCQYYNDCKHKRKVACAYLEPLSNYLVQPLAEPVAAEMAVKHNYRDIKIGENTIVTIDIEEVKKKISEDIYKAIGCNFLQGGA